MAEAEDDWAATGFQTCPSLPPGDHSPSDRRAALRAVRARPVPQAEATPAAAAPAEEAPAQRPTLRRVKAKAKPKAVAALAATTAEVEALREQVKSLSQLLGKQPKAEQKIVPAPAGVPPHVMTEARLAGITPEQLRTMAPFLMPPGRLTGPAPTKPRPATLGPRPSALKAKPRYDPLDEEEFEGEDVAGEPSPEKGAVNSSDSLSLAALVVKQSEILANLVSRQKDPFQGLFDEAGGGGEAASSVGGVKGIALRQELRQLFHRKPEVFYQYVEKQINLRGTSDDDLDIVVPPPYYLEHKAVLGTHRPTILWTWLMGQILHRLQKGQQDHARALAALGLAMGEQLAMDRGSFHLAWLITMLPDAPVQTIMARRNDPDVVEPHSPLINPNWFASHLAYLKDADTVVERREKAMKTRNPTPKFDPKGRGRGKGKGAAEAEEVC